MSHSGTAGDAAAAQAVRRHHAQLAEGLERRAEALLHLVETGDRRSAERVRQELLAYLRHEVVPHARAEESTLYPAAAAQQGIGPLIEGMLGEHVAITGLVDELAGAASLTRAAAAGRALAALFATHLAKENDLILPVLVGAAEVSLAELLEGMHDLLGAGTSDEAPQTTEAGGCGCGGCDCGGGGGGERAGAGAAPVLAIDGRLDVRDLPGSQRHAVVLASVAALHPGQALVLVAPHAPRPVLAEVQAQFGDEITTQWLETGPEVWQVRLERAEVHAGV